MAVSLRPFTSSFGCLSFCLDFVSTGGSLPPLSTHGLSRKTFLVGELVKAAGFLFLLIKCLVPFQQMNRLQMQLVRPR